MPVLLNSRQLKDWDRYTIQSKGISSIDLMEDAARALTRAFIEEFPDTQKNIWIFCGNGNNGGDGLAMARMLLLAGYSVQVILLRKEERSEENIQNLERYKALHGPIVFHDELSLPANDMICIDALLGTGFRNSPDTQLTNAIQCINQLQVPVISIDIPSGLHCDFPAENTRAVRATYTFTIQCLKRCFLFEESGCYSGLIRIMNIGLSNDFPALKNGTEWVSDMALIRSMYKPRVEFSHKGTYGHCLLAVGSHGMAGAAIMSASACVRSGCGLTTVFLQESELPLVQASVPEAIAMGYETGIATCPDWNAFTSIAVGCGLGKTQDSYTLTDQLLTHRKLPVLLDADALNILSEHKDWILRIPKDSLITPHPKEFDRLFGAHVNSQGRYETQKLKSNELGIYILLKGHYSTLCTPNGLTYFNGFGNSGLAKGGSGDILTGLIGGLYAVYKNYLEATLIGLFIQGVAAEKASEARSKESMTPMDVVQHFHEGFQLLQISK
ncbi:MAG TPA: NAD(P)H-hydrate dehydratase [Chitinophagaceae bacterium]|nr:NAD(P)H-hydrate dehydratase [Chitinophagaceae bacterium]